jgi:hypothetical protein
MLTRNHMHSPAYFTICEVVNANRPVLLEFRINNLWTSLLRPACGCLAYTVESLYQLLEKLPRSADTPFDDQDAAHRSHTFPQDNTGVERLTDYWDVSPTREAALHHASGTEFDFDALKVLI